MRVARRILPLLCSLAFAGWGSVFAASNDNNIEADGIWHDAFDLAPSHPARGNAFTVELQAFRYDLTGASVRLYDGATVRVVPMVWNREKDGTYDIWRAEIGPVESDFAYYHFQLRDGSAYATFAGSGFWGHDPPGGDFLLNLTPLGAFPLGATVDGADAVFRVWAPGAEAAELILDPEGETPIYLPMASVQGFWQLRAAGVGHGRTYKFRFLRDGAWLVRNDPRAKWLPETMGYSIVQRSDYEWEDAAWVIPDLEDSIVSEAHVGTFSGRGDGATGHPGTFRDMADRHVAHLVESGINVLQLMPLQEFPGAISWGYNPAFLFAPESSYGTPEDFKYLVNKCHKAGIAVWLDVVLNHFDEHSLPGNLGQFDGDDIYFYSAASGLRDTGFGPRPDYGRVEVRDYLVGSMRHFIEEYHIDGFRLDHTSLVKINREGWMLLKEITQMRSRVNPRVMITAEQWPNDSAVTRPVRWGGAGLDAQWSDIFHDNSRAALNQLAYGDPSMQAIADGLNHFGFAQREMINFIESHDEARESPQFAYEGRIVQVADQINPHSDFGLGRGKLFYGLTLYGSAVPLLLYGQEIATEIGFGDKEQNKIPWEHKQAYAPYFKACRDMTWLRRKSPALRADRWQSVFHQNDSANVLAWERAHDGHHVIVVANFSNIDWGNYWVGLPQGGTWYEVINTNASEYGGTGIYQNGTFAAFNGPSGPMPYSAPLQLPRYSLVVLAKHDYDLTPDLDADNDGIEDAWEQANALDPNDEGDAATDRDGDGQEAEFEFLLQTDPRVANPPPLPALDPVAGGMAIGFPLVPNRRYQLEMSEDLVDWTPLDAPRSTRGESAPDPFQFVDPDPETPGNRFYRFDVRYDR